MKGNNADIVRLNHISDAISFVGQFAANKSKQDIYEDFQFRFAVERQLEIMGEAARSRLTEQLKNDNPAVAWQQIISFRNFIAHEYFGLDLELVWDVVENHLPVLKEQIQHILNGLADNK